MKKMYVTTFLIACFSLAMHFSLQAQQQSDEKDVIIITTTQDDGTVTVKKKRIEKGESVETYKDLIELKEEGQKIEILIKGDDEVDQKGESLFFFKDGDSGKTIEINGSGDWMESLKEMKFDFRNDHNQSYEVIEKTKTFLGVYPESGEKGVEVTGIVSGSGAEKAGLKRGDIMLAINGTAIQTNDDLRTELAKYKPGDAIQIDVDRDGARYVITSELTGKTERIHQVKRDPCNVFYGVYVGSYGPDKQGVGVSGIIPGWPAESAGLKKGDRILAIDGISVNNHRELVTERDKHEPGEYFTITYLRDDTEYEVEAQFKVCPKDPQDEWEEEKLPEINEPLPFSDNSLDLEEFSAYPNPTFGDVNITFRGEAVPTTVMVTDVNGKVVFRETLNNFDGIYNQQLDVSKGALGTLNVTVSQSGKVFSKPIVLITRA